MTMRTFGRLSYVYALLTCALLCVALPARAQSGSVSLAWDPNPEAAVAGYVVYVTRTPDGATQRFDAAALTRFTYANVAPGVGYGFSVAAYTSEGIEGPRSATVFFMAGTTSGASPTFMTPVVPPTLASIEPNGPATPRPAAAGALYSTRTVDGSAVCVEGSSSDCYTARALVTMTERITALAAFPDGRVAFVEGGRHVRIVNADAGNASETIAFSVEAPVEIGGLVTDPAFATTRAIYASVVETSEGRRALSIVRYRELDGVLGQAAVVVSGISLPETGGVPFTMDSRGRILLAVPGMDAQARTADGLYAASVLRFESDGSASADNGNGSPVFARGYAEPSAMGWNAQGASLWLSGRGAPWAGSLALVPNDSGGTTSPRIPVPAGSWASTTSALAALTVDSSGMVKTAAVEASSGALLQLSSDGQRVAAVRLVLPLGLDATLVEHSMSGGYFVVVRDTTALTDTLIRLDPR